SLFAAQRLFAHPPYSSSISPSMMTFRSVRPRVSVTLAGSFSLSLRRPCDREVRTASSIARWPVIPTFLRNLRRLMLNTSSFMLASRQWGCSRSAYPKDARSAALPCASELDDAAAGGLRQRIGPPYRIQLVQQRPDMEF